MRFVMPNKNQKINKMSRSALAVTALIAVALIAGAFLLLIRGVNKEILASNIDSMEELALHDQNSIKNSIELRWSNMEGAETRMSARQWNNTQELISALKDLTNNVPGVDKISMLDSNGTEYNSTGLVRKNSYLADAVEDKSERFIIRLNSEGHFRENKFEMLMLGIPVDFNVNGNQMKWMICQFPITILENELKINSYDDNGFSSVIDETGNYIINISRSHNLLEYDNFYDDIEGAEFDDYGSVEELKSATTTTTTTGIITVTYIKDGVEKIMVITPIDYAGWYFLTVVPISVFEVQTNAILKIFFIMFGAIVIVAGAIMFVIYRQRKADEKLKLSEAANRSKTEFLFNMSHDIRTPMNAILGYTDIGLRHMDDSVTVSDSLTKIKTAGGHLLNLINDILEMSRIESGKLELDNRPLDIREVIKGVEQMSNSLATDKEVDFSVEVGKIDNPYILADELHVNEIIINLISNAVKYTPRGGNVVYSIDQIEGDESGKAKFRFAIKDNGIGMSEEFQQHLFETFSREKTSTVSKIEGTGIGLSIVKKIVDISDGTITVDSKLGEGSTFTVELSFEIMSESAIEEFIKEKENTDFIDADANLEGKRVLLVEDNEMNREIATELLEESGLIVEEAEDGRIAVDKIKEVGTDYYDYILMDIQMPVMNGYEATEAIREMAGGDKVPIIALSANAFEEDKKKSSDAGMNAHVAKPINVKELFEVLTRF